MSTPPKLYDVHEASPLVRKSVSWLYQQAGLRTIPVTRIGRNIFWTDAQITQIITAGAQEPKAPAKRSTRKRAATVPAPVPAPRSSRLSLAPAGPNNIPEADRSVSRLYRNASEVAS